MSWDISIQDLPVGIRSISEIPNDYTPGDLGRRDDLIARILQVLPDIDFSDHAWGILDRPEFSIEFNMGGKEICSGFMLHVRGGSEAIVTIEQLLEHLKLRAFDCQAGDLFSREAAQASFDQWRAYRDQAIN